jgi:hypothetical protein
MLTLWRSKSELGLQGFGVFGISWHWEQAGLCCMVGWELSVDVCMYFDVLMGLTCSLL